MQIAIAIVSIGLAIFMAVAGFLNVFFVGDARKNQAHLRISVGLTRFIGWCQWASVVGLIGGLFWRPLAIAAAIGLLLLLIGAVIAHRRVNDPMKEMILAIAVFVLSAFVLAGQISLLGEDDGLRVADQIPPTAQFPQ
ncbi:DoxX family protein [Mycolicibacterium litorale]|uniref:DoxX family protein n=1 Tax=Mycolicibacterium litorale TaxID=758802 RepID=UPI003CED596C